MNYSSDAAEQVVRMSLNGVEVAAKISGKAAERLAVMLYAVMKDQKRTKGKIRLTSLLKSGKELKVFAINDANLAKFCEEAKRYGILYCVLKDKNATDGLTDIMVKAEDASKINRIFERFKFSAVDMAQVKSEVTREKEKAAGIAEPDRATTKTMDDAEYMRGVMGLEREGKIPNPSEAKTEKSHPSEPISGSSSRTVRESSEERKRDKPSVREELEEIRQELREQRGGRTPQRTNEHIEPPKKKIKSKER